MTTAKAAHTLTLEDVLAHPVWRYKDEAALRAGEDEGWVEPVSPDKVAEAQDHFFAATATLADGSPKTVLVGNTEPLDPQYNKQVQFFVFFAQKRQLRWDPNAHSGVELARFLGMPPRSVFPFKFSIARHLAGDPEALERTVWARGMASEA